MKPESYIAKIYNYQFLKGGDTMALFMAAHELGHALSPGSGYEAEYRAGNFANSIIKSYPRGIDTNAYRCDSSCE